MNKKITTTALLNFIFLFISHVAFSQTYVNINASGNNDGTSWTDAYIDLADALENTSFGEIWVAQGTYLPTTSLNGSVSFIVESGLFIYGGFDGTETGLSQRDFTNNITVLSGDINGDDVEDDFETNRADNAAHVLYIDSLINSTVILDGFNIVSGHTGDDPDLAEINWRGGGVFSYSGMEVQNCNFSQNFARGGAGIYLTSGTGGGSNSSFIKCTFTKNRASSQSAGMFLNSVSDITIRDCDFSFNETTRGAFYPLFCNLVMVTDCTFTNNETLTNTDFGGAVFAWNNSSLIFSGCQFVENTAGNGGVIYLDGRETEINTTEAAFSGCTFSGNRALDFGGGVIYSWMSTHDISNSTFGSNFADNGSHIFNGGNDKRINYSQVEFVGGSSIFGGAINCYGSNAFYDLETCSFRGNQAATSGGAIIGGFGAEINISDSEFLQNTASFGGGISIQNDLTNLNISRCLFETNSATQNGGAVSVGSSGNLSIIGSVFKENTADVGGGLHVAESIDSLGSLVLELMDSEFNGNTAESQGAGINLLNVNGNISNVVCNNNFNLTGIAGGGLSINASDNADKTLNITNATIVNNFAPIGGGIATFTDSTSSILNLNIQNTILFNTGSKNYEVEGGTPAVNSLGGNLSGDLTTTDLFTNALDQNNVVDMFFVNGQSDYHLTAQSPAVNAGVDAGAPILDIEGNPRVGTVDAGAYEFQQMVNTSETIFSGGSTLSIFPNPVSQFLNLSFDSNWTGGFNITLFSMDGKAVMSFHKDKRDADFDDKLDVSSLQSNIYQIVIDNGQESVVRKFIKVK